MFLAGGAVSDMAGTHVEERNSGLKLAIVIPTRCEVDNIRRLLTRIKDNVDPLAISYELIVVDDDSNDGTERVVQELSDKDSRIRLLIRKKSRGLAGAVIHGWQNTDADILGVIDADLQHPPEVLPRLLNKIQSGADIAIGTRYASTNCQHSWSTFRGLVSQLATRMAAPLQKPDIPVSDPMSGFFVVRRACIQSVKLQPTGFKLLLEILVKGNIQSVAEVPFTFGQRCAGRSKASLPVMIDYLSLLVRLWMRKISHSSIE
jgi:dolichol-phosphate mannosyltransferase